MQWLTLIPTYLEWHYGKAFRDIFTLWRNMLWFVYHFFSVPTLIKTFFSPWKRIHEEKGSALHPAEFFSTLVINTMMRGVGVVVRGSLLLVAGIFLTATLLAGVIVFVLWPLAPVVAGGLIIVSVGVLFKNPAI